MKAPQNKGAAFEMLPTGYSLGVCTRVIDVGTHFNEKKQKDERKIMIALESEKKMTTGDFAGEPFLVFANYNYSMYQNSMLCGFVENWLGRKFTSQDEADNFDPSTLLRMPAFMNIVRSEDGKFTNIQTIGPVPDGMTAPLPVGKIILIDQDSLDPKEVEKLTDKMKAKVLGAKEQAEPKETTSQHATMGVNTGYANTENPGEGCEDFNDDLPPF